MVKVIVTTWGPGAVDNYGNPCFATNTTCETFKFRFIARMYCLFINSMMPTNCMVYAEIEA